MRPEHRPRRRNDRGGNAAPQPDSHSGLTALNPGGLEAEPPEKSKLWFLSNCLPVVPQWLRRLPRLGLLLRQSFRFKPRHFVRSKPDHNLAIELFVYRHLATTQGVAPAGLFDLQNPVVQRDGVVRVYRALVLNRKHPVQILAAGPHKRTAFARRGYREPAVELGPVNGSTAGTRYSNSFTSSLALSVR